MAYDNAIAIDNVAVEQALDSLVISSA